MAVIIRKQRWSFLTISYELIFSVFFFRSLNMICLSSNISYAYSISFSLLNEIENGDFLEYSSMQ